ncbi:hypothetical protein KAR48_12895 [bacterium]|nr:hypothetical protein [bacterium]
MEILDGRSNVTELGGKINISKITGIILFFMFITPKLHSQSFPYLSPGIRIGWAGQEGITFTVKFSIGLNSDEDLRNLEYYNFTLGAKTTLSKNQNKHRTMPFPFFQLQYGREPFKGSGVFAGGGMGFALINSEGNKIIRPFITIDAGLLLFPSVDILFKSLKDPFLDLGLLLVAPIPMKSI